MGPSVFEDEIIRGLRQLPVEEHKQVLDFVRFLQQRQYQGASGQDLLIFADSISVDQVKQIEQAIQTECEQVDADER